VSIESKLDKVIAQNTALAGQVQTLVATAATTAQLKDQAAAILKRIDVAAATATEQMNVLGSAIAGVVQILIAGSDEDAILAATEKLKTSADALAAVLKANPLPKS
jgi:hypothetical protein